MSDTMGRYEHGGFTAEGVVDFSASLNPLGMPGEVVATLRDCADAYEAYPDPSCYQLRQALAGVCGVEASRIVCGAGASDLILRLCLAERPKSALVVDPCFSGYEHAFEQVGCQLNSVALAEEGDFDIDADLICAQIDRSRPDILFLCNPNNPTARLIGEGQFGSIISHARGRGVLVVVDECFLGLTHGVSVLDSQVGSSGVVVLNAFTKTYAMAGLRLGYAICPNDEFACALEGAGQPWPVSAPALVAGIEALAVSDWLERSRRAVDEGRAYLESQLRSLGMRVVPSQANFILFRSDVDLYDALLERGYAIRRCGNFRGLDDSWYRVAVRTPDENEGLITALEEVVA